MRQTLWMIFAVIFAVNTVSLSAYANQCVKMSSSQSQQAEKPNCHEAGMDMRDTIQQPNQNEPQSSDKTHCDGVCFCQHVLLNNHIMPVDTQLYVPVFFTTEAQAFMKDAVYSNAVFPPFRPPIFIS